eukprot:scaffold6933_cov178-Amphora_coffeaeformis.AAC.2
MGKKKGKKADIEKKAALEARKEAKAEKVARKRLQKQGGDDDDSDGSDDDEQQENHLDSLLQQYQAADKASTTTTTETLDSFPLPRANATLTLYEDTKKKNAELYLFGGEYFDGVENIFLNHLLKYDIGKKEWRRIHCPTVPPPRCAHSCVYYNHSFYVFGGEISRSEQFYHYKDLWRYDIKALKWEELKPSKAVGSHPTARSGHVAVVWKNFMIIFGGFFEANKETPRWYNEVFVMNLQTQQWLDVPHSKLSIRPEPRSACNATVIGDDVVIQGGFSKLSKSALQMQKAGELEMQSETKVHTDSWILHLKPLLDEKPPTWERLTSSVQRTARTVSKSPNGRAAMASSSYKNRMLAYGGCFDTEEINHRVNSVFYNDMFAFDLERRKWFPMVVKEHKRVDNNSGRKKETSNTMAIKEETTAGEDSEGDFEEEDLNESNVKDSGWNLQKLRSNMFAFIDGNGNVVYEKPDSDEEVSPSKLKNAEEDENEEEKEEVDDESPRRGTQGGVFEMMSSAAHQCMKNSSVMKLNSKTNQPEAVVRADPLPRINACMAISANTLFLYGGLLEVGDREITLDDMWTLDLKKRQAWECIWPGTMHKQVWRGAAFDDDDSYYSTDNKTDRAGDDEEDDVEEKDDTEKKEESQNDGTSRKDQLKAQLLAIRDEHGLADSDRTPGPGESLSDFYERTSKYWSKQTRFSKESGASSQEIKQQGFALAKERFDSLTEVLNRFVALDLEYRKEKKARKDKKKGKKDH